MKLLVITSMLYSLSVAVDRSNFKTCDQSGFCKRHRAIQPGQSEFKALLGTVSRDSNSIKVILVSSKNEVKYELQVIALKDNTARVRLRDLESERERYEPPVGDVLKSEPQKDSLELSARDSSQMVMTMKEHKIVLQAEPFRLDFITGQDLVLSLNSRGLLKYEHFRRKGGATDDQDNDENQGEDPKDGEEEKPEGEQEEEQKETPGEPDMWEETFKTHQDSKPYGPMSVGVDISFPGFEHVYGIPEHADSLALRSTKSTDPYRLYNLDVFEYEVNNPMALYGSVPFMIAHNEHRTVGMFWLNAAETWIDIGSNVADKGTFSKLLDFVKGDSEMPQVDTHWFSESGIIDVFVLLGPNPRDVFKQYSKLTGTTPLPPLFSLAYHQSRWNYNDEQDVASVDSGFDNVDIPMDVIWLDIEHTDGKRYFTWDSLKFPNSEEMLKNISAKGRKMVTIVDPHIKRDGGYHIHSQCEQKDVYIKNKDGNVYDGWCWPGSSSWPDFLDPEIRNFWASQFSKDSYKGSTDDLYIWNDMNEPSVFNGPEITMHKDAKHMDGWEHRDVHNVYGMHVHRATFEGLLHRSDNQVRPFVLTRAFFAGSQRTAAVWTGDNTGEWSHLKISLPMVMSLNLAGITFSGADIGGFFKNPDHELLTRWYQAAAFQPFMRAHAHLDTRRREPWLLPENHQRVIREAVRTRYQLLPYWYTLFFKSEQDGMPIVRPTWVEHPDIKDTFEIDDQHFVGSDLLVKPVTDAGATSITVYLPGHQNRWYDRTTLRSTRGGGYQTFSVDLDKIPYFQRGGSIIPEKRRIRRASSLTVDDPYTLVVALDAKMKASGDLYYDDYHTYKYKQGEFVYRQFTFDNNELTSRAIVPSSWSSSAWLEKIVILGYPKAPTSASISGTGIETTNLDVIYDTKSRSLTIRKPAINTASDFVITIQ